MRQPMLLLKLLLTSTLMGSVPMVFADTPILPRTNLPSYKQECAACHMAYPAGFLPAQSWKQMMATLPKHFGVDASIDDPALLKEISGWLQSNAGTYKRAGEVTPSNRITDSAWFARKHREIADEIERQATLGAEAMTWRKSARLTRPTSRPMPSTTATAGADFSCRMRKASSR